MKNTIEIVPASLENLDELSRLFQRYRIFYKMEPDEEGEKAFLKERITNKESVIYLAKNGNDFIGFVQLFPIFSSTRISRLWLLNDLYVNEEFRKTGAATLLIERSKQLVKETNYAGLMLQTAKTNTTAQSVYDRNDFIQDDNFYSYYWFNK
jgi:GNAT superfamily N-acetyltransferase